MEAVEGITSPSRGLDVATVGTASMTGPTPRLEYGQRVRVACGATGRYLSDGLALVVSSMCNDLFVDRVNPDDTYLPHPTLPVPSDDALAGAAEALSYASLHPLATS